MIEFDGCLAPERIVPSGHHHHHHHHHGTGHVPQSYYHHHVMESSSSSSTTPLNHPHPHSTLSQHQQGQQHQHHLQPPQLPPPPPSQHHPHHHHPRLNSLLTKTEISDQLTSTNHMGQQHHHTVAKKSHNNHHNHHHQHQNQSSADSKKQHSQIVSKLQQSISSRLKSTTNIGDHSSSNHHHHSHSHLPPLSPSSSHVASSPSAVTPSIISAKSTTTTTTNQLMTKISTMTTTSSTTTTSTMINSNPPTPTNNNNNGFEYESAAALKKKKKSHLSRDELSRVCHDGDVTFEQYNGSTYMIAIRSQGDRKSLIGYRCDWNNCGYMNARVERMFGHIRSQHPDAPAVKKLVTTTGGSTNTTSSVVTTTTATTTTNNSCGGSSATCTSNTNANHANMSTSTSARLSLRSSSSLSTASSTSSGSLSPRSSLKCGTNMMNQSPIIPTSPTPSLSSIPSCTATNSNLLNVHKTSTLSSSSSSSSSSSFDNVPSYESSGDIGSECHRQPNSSNQHNHQQRVTTSPGECSSQTHVGDKLIDLLNNQPTSAIDDDDLQHDNVNDELLNIGLPPIKSIDDHTVLDTGINECETKKSYCENKLDELAQSTERIMEELKTISANFEVAAISSTTATSTSSSTTISNSNSGLNVHDHGSANSVDRNNNHQGQHDTTNTNTITLAESNNSNNSNNNNNNNHNTTSSNMEIHPKVEDTLELFDDDIESLLMNHGSKSSVDNNGYQQHNSSNNNNNQSDNVYHDQQQQQPQPLPSSTQSPIINESPATFHHHQTNTAAKPMEHQVDYQDSYSHSMNDYSYDTTTNNSNNNLEYQVNNQMHNHQQQQQQQHTQSRQSDPLMYGDNGEWNEHDMDSTMMMDDGSNGSVGSNSGSKRDRKKTGSSKNYIGKQNLFQEFQSDDVAKVRDSENKYIIALQKNMKIVGYRCDWPECEFLTCRKYVMVNHINGKHTNQRPYSCPLCNFNFVKRYFLKAHMHKVHKRRISIDGKDDDDLIGGMKRDHSELMDSSFDDEQYDGIDTMVPDTPSTPIPVTSSKKAKNGIKTNSSSTYAPKGPPFYSNPESGYGPPYNSCPPPLPPPVPNTTPNNSDIYSMEPTTMVPNAYYNGYGTPNGTQPVNGCYYGDDSYGSDLSNHGFKSNQLNNTTSAVFMTPSPSSSIASPLPFTANGPGTPNTKCTSFNPITYEPFESPMYQQAPPSNQPTQQQPFLNRSYSTPSSSSSSSMYSTCNSNTAGPIVKSNSVGSNPMINQTDLLTPPLSNGPNCGGTRSTNDTAASMFPNQSADQSTFTSFTDSTNGYTNNSSSNGNNQGFDDFLSPPSSISSSGSNYSSSYMGAMCPDQQSGNNNTSANVNSSVSANSGANQRQVNGNTPTSMANASSFYLHTPSPSPSSLSHSPASASMYSNNGNNGSAYGNSISQPMQQSANTQYSNSGPTNFANSFNTEASYNGKPSSRSYSNCPPQPPTYGSSSASANSYDQCYYDQNSSSAYGNSMLNVGNGRKSFPTGGYNNGFVNGINNTNQTVNGGNGSMFVDPYNTIDSYGNVPSKPVTGGNIYNGNQTNQFMSNGATECWNSSW